MVYPDPKQIFAHHANICPERDEQPFASFNLVCTSLREQTDGLLKLCIMNYIIVFTLLNTLFVMY